MFIRIHDDTGAKINNIFTFLENITRMKFIFINMIKKNLMDENKCIPSIAILVDKNNQIKPFWNDKIKKISENLFMSTMTSINNLNHSHVKQFSSLWFDYKHYNTDMNNQCRSDKENK